MTQKYKFLPHTADIKFQAFGKTLSEAFENAVLAISDYLTKSEKIKSLKVKIIEVTGNDKENLFYNFLEELLFLFETECFIAANAKVTIKKNQLRCELNGDSARNYHYLGYIKAATYSEMEIKKTKTGWKLQAVMDV